MYSDHDEPSLTSLVKSLQDGPVHDRQYALAPTSAGFVHWQTSTLLLQQGDNGGGPGDDGGVELNAQGKPKRKRKRDTHQQELNKQAQHRYRSGKQS